MDSSSDTCLVQVTVDEDGVAMIEINRPEKRNALSQKTIDSLVSAIAMVERDSKIRVAILSGSRTAGPFSGMISCTTCPTMEPIAKSSEEFSLNFGPLILFE